MSKLTMLVGLPASGKSTWAEKYKENSIIISSDKIREVFLGDEADQTGNQTVFNIARLAIAHNLDMGKDVILDATNVDRKLRNNFIKDIRSTTVNKHTYDSMFFPVPYEECIVRNEKRERTIPISAINNMYMKITPVTSDENFNYNVVYHEKPPIKFELSSFIKTQASAEKFFPLLDQYNNFRSIYFIQHDNPHHPESIGEHIFNVYNNVWGNIGRYRNELIAVALFHDIGKPHTKFYNEKKNHFVFYGHESVSSYISTLYSFDVDNFDYDFFYKTIKYHMICHQHHEMAENYFKDIDSQGWFKLFLEADEKGKGIKIG